MNKCFFTLFIALVVPVVLCAEKPQFWQTILQPIAKIKDIEFRFRQEYRFELDNLKATDARFSLMSEKKLNKTWDAGINFTLVNFRDPDENPFRQRYRWEFDLNPHFKLSKNVELRLRNRYEIVKDEDEPQWAQIFRQRHQFVLKVDIGALKSISIHNEIFYSLTRERFDQDRFVPLEMSFKVWKDHTYRLFFMIRWLRPLDAWEPQFVLGSTLDW